MGNRYIKDITRLDLSFFDIKAWYGGENDELKRAIGFGFENTIFVIKKRNVTLYYDEEECEKFYEVLDEKLTEDFFHELCDRFFELIEESRFADSDEEIFDLMIRCGPPLAIFHEISNYPEYGTPSMIRRLMRVRENTQDFIYGLSKKLDLKFETPDSYLFFQGKLIEKPFEDFIKEKDIEIVKWTEKN